jgi:hypothetical protein
LLGDAKGPGGKAELPTGEATQGPSPSFWAKPELDKLSLEERVGGQARPRFEKPEPDKSRGPRSRTLGSLRGRSCKKAIVNSLLFRNEFAIAFLREKDDGQLHAKPCALVRGMLERRMEKKGLVFILLSGK